MLFNSIIFPIFFIVFYGLYIFLKHRSQNILLLVASYIFYGWWNWRFLFLIFFSTVVDYYCSIAIVNSQLKQWKKHFLIISICTNLGLLAFFKYFDFFLTSLQLSLAIIGINIDFYTLNILLPIGISFYTFQTMSYTIDVYLGKIKPARNLLDFAVFISFFPQLVAGPIERAEKFLPQVQKKRKITFNFIREGLWLILFGYFKKVVVADNCAGIADLVFNNPAHQDFILVLLGVYAFAWQIYGDFSGYTDIARGISKIMGFDLMINFKMPYFSTNPQEFWQRWHISLSSWLRDYLYIPLGGNRNGNFKTYRNLLITMVLGGLWHGAAFKFIVWGAYQGIILIIHRICNKQILAKNKNDKKLQALENRIIYIVKIILFFQIICLGWVLFRINKMSDIFFIVESMTHWNWHSMRYIIVLMIYISPVLLIDIIQEQKNNILAIKELQFAWRFIIYLFLFGLILICGNFQGNSFIYFQF